MSGRLIILPKKSYCPWNPRNVERVEQDEREHKKKQEQEKKQKDQEKSQSRLKALRKRTREEIDDIPLQRFSLFENEERDHQERARDELLHGNVGTGTFHVSRHVKMRRNPGTSPSKNDDNALYTKSNLGVDEFTLRNSKKEAGVKERLDPMRQFHHLRQQDWRYISSPPSIQQIPTSKEHAEDEKQKTHKRGRQHSPDRGSHHDDSSVTSLPTSSCSQREKRKSKRHKKKKKKSRKHQRHDSKERGGSMFLCDESDGNAATNDILVELRRRRAKREDSERKRQEHVLGNTLEKRQYWDQYNPRLSRK
jgi:hypothetical protein